MAEVKPAYLIAGGDGAKIGAARARLRARAEREGGPGALAVFEPGEGQGAPDADATVAALSALSLGGGRRYVLADGVERWRAEDQAKVASALAELPPDTTLVLIARGKAPDKLADAVRACGGEALTYDPDGRRETPLVWKLADAIAAGDAAHALELAERLLADGEAPARLVYPLAASLRRKRRPDLRGATEALADLELWTRGGADYPDDVALTLALRRAAGAAA